MSRWIATSDGYLPAPRPTTPTPLNIAIQETITTYRNSSYDAFALQVDATPVTPADPRLSHRGRRPQNPVYEYSFDWTRSRTRRLPTRQNFHTKAIEVRLYRTWRLLTSFLAQEAARDPTNPNRAVDIDPLCAVQHRYSHQFSWWSSNGKKFQFLDLPKELRELVYDFCSGESLEPFAKNDLRKWGAWRPRHETKLNSSLLKCHPFIANEMRVYLFSKLSMLLTHQKFLLRTLGNDRFPRQELRSVTLAFPTYSAFFHFFGLQAKDLDTDLAVNWLPHTSAKTALNPKNLPKLREFKIVIPGRESLDDVAFLAGGCQVKTAEMVFERVWPFVRGLPVVVEGMVKWTQKKDWERRARIESERFKFEENLKSFEKSPREAGDEEEEEDGGVKVTEEMIEAFEDEIGDLRVWDDEEEYDELARLPVMDLPPVCRCKVKCPTGEWTP